MGLTVTFVSGPRRSGKSLVITAMIQKLWKAQPHYIRLARCGGDKVAPKKPAQAERNCGVASARWIEYDPDRVFEVLPEALTSIHKKDRYGSVIIEADADPVVRSAYTYDHRVFVMPLPGYVCEVFRDSKQAAEELHRVLDDTTAFASEIFGLLTMDGQEETDPSEPRVDLTATQMRGFLYSPLGDELATRIQLQPPYHGLVESDVIIINPFTGVRGEETDVCLQRLDRLLERVRVVSGRRPETFRCDPGDESDRETKRLWRALKPMGASGK